MLFIQMHFDGVNRSRATIGLEALRTGGLGDLTARQPRAIPYGYPTDTLRVPNGCPTGPRAMPKGVGAYRVASATLAVPVP
jgi:hypothetical protein